MNKYLTNLTGSIDSFMYTYILVILLVFAGVYFSIRTGFVQIRFIGDMFKHITEKKARQRRKGHQLVPGYDDLHRFPRWYR